jgi:hypothetical protein
METLDIVNLIEKSPITRLRKDYENKLLTKIKNTFTDTQQQLFVGSFYAYLNYNSKTDFVIDFDDVWKWVGYSRKNDAKRVLEKHFIFEVDFKLEKFATEVTVANFEEEKSPERRGGSNKETILLSINTFKKFCMKANTNKADEIHDYYIKLEELLQETINEESQELKNEITEKEKKLSKLQEVHNRLVYKRNRHKLKKGRCCYILINPNNQKNKKIGKTKNMNLRSAGYCTYFEPCFLYVIFTEDNDLLEKCIKKRYKLTREWIDDIELEELINVFELFAKELKLDYTSYRNMDDLKVELETEEELNKTEEDDDEKLDNNDEEDNNTEVGEVGNELLLLKYCKNCNSDLEYDSFNKDITKSDGLHTTCRSCEKVNKMAYKNKERVEITEKECAICLEVKDVSNFSVHKYTADGYVRQCLDCMKKITNDKRNADKENKIRYKCGKCGKDYSRKDTLTKHQKNCETL